MYTCCMFFCSRHLYTLIFKRINICHVLLRDYSKPKTCHFEQLHLDENARNRDEPLTDVVGRILKGITSCQLQPQFVFYIDIQNIHRLKGTLFSKTKDFYPWFTLVFKRGYLQTFPSFEFAILDSHVVQPSRGTFGKSSCWLAWRQTFAGRAPQVWKGVKRFGKHPLVLGTEIITPSLKPTWQWKSTILNRRWYVFKHLFFPLSY